MEYIWVFPEIPAPIENSPMTDNIYRELPSFWNAPLRKSPVKGVEVGGPRYPPNLAKRWVEGLFEEIEGNSLRQDDGVSAPVQGHHH